MAKSKRSGHAGSKLRSKLTFKITSLLLLICAPTAYSSGDITAPGGVVVREARHSGGHHSSFGTPTEAPFGFFVDGSSIPGINGMYGPKLPHTGTDGQVREIPERLEGQIHLGAYPHDSSGWWLVNLRHGFGPEASGGPEWVFIDPRY